VVATSYIASMDERSRWVVVMSLCAASVGCSGSTSTTPPARYRGVADAITRGEVPDTTSVLVMRHGAIDYEAYFNGADADTLLDTRSVTKTITGLALGAALDRKIVPSLATPVFPYFTDLAPANMSPAKSAITIEDLVTMSSTLDCDDDDDASPGNEARMYPKDAWLRFVVDLPARGTYTRDARGRGPWHYCTVGVFLTGQLLQRAAKQRADELIAAWIMKPLGITRWKYEHSPMGEIMTGGMLRLTTRDLGKLGWMIRSDGAGIVSAPFIRAMQTAQAHTTFKQDPEYGYWMWGRDYSTPCGTTRGWRMSGNGGNAVIVLAELDAVIVVTRTHYNSKGMHDQTARLVEHAILPEISCGK